jgi:hypothetical protein
MNPIDLAMPLTGHTHVFLGTGHERNERRTWGVIVLCGVMMLAEIIADATELFRQVLRERNSR